MDCLFHIFSNCGSCACTKTNESVPGSPCWVEIFRSRRSGDVSPGTNRWGYVQANVSVSARIFAIISELVAFEMQRLKARSWNKQKRRHSSWFTIEDLISLIMDFDEQFNPFPCNCLHCLGKFNQCGCQWFTAYFSLDDSNKICH